MAARPTRKRKTVDYRHMIDFGGVEVDDRVEVEFKGAWYPAVVKAVNDDGTFEILYDTDETESHVPAASVRKINSLTGSDAISVEVQRAFCRFGVALIVSFTQRTTRSPSSSPWRTKRMMTTRMRTSRFSKNP